VPSFGIAIRTRRAFKRCFHFPLTGLDGIVASHTFSPRINAGERFWISRFRLTLTTVVSSPSSYRRTTSPDGKLKQEVLRFVCSTCISFSRGER